MFTGSDESTKHDAGGFSSSRPHQYKYWDEARMQRAIDACVSGGMAIRQAALRFGVPKSTLGDRISGRVLPGASCGPKGYLTPEEEEELVNFLLRCAAMGYPKSRHEVLALVKRILEKKRIDAVVTSGWWQSFCGRHPNLTLRTPAPLSGARASATDPEVICRYFDLLERTMADNKLIDQPCLVFNMDESGMPLDPKQLKSVCKRGEKRLLGPSSGDKTQITVVACISASGSCMPPMVILDRKTLPPYFTEGEVPGTIYGLSTKGWIDQELFDIWFTRHFLRYAPLARPLLLLLDGHSSHHSPDTIRLAAKEQVIVFALPPHTTHFSQPADKGCFGPLKTHWKSECHSFMTSNPGVFVSRYNFSKLFSAAWMKAMTIANITGGFKTTGVFPLNRNAIKLPESVMEKLPEQSGLKFIPLYSPANPKKSVPDFSEGEMKTFPVRYENGYDLHDERYDVWLRKYHPEDLSLDGSSDSEVATISFLEPNEDSDRGDISQLQSNEEPLSSPESSFFKLQSCKRLSRRSSSYPRVHYRHESPSPPRCRCKPSRTRSSSVEHLKSLISAAITAVNRAGRSRVVSVQSCKYCVCVCVCVGVWVWVLGERCSSARLLA